jgi:hypothetical protein
MAISNPASLKERLRAARTAFRRGIAEKLRKLSGDVIDGGERLTVELPDAGGESARVAVEFSEGVAPRSDLCEWVRLQVEEGENVLPLLTLGWAVEDGVKLLDPDPLHRVRHLALAPILGGLDGFPLACGLLFDLSGGVLASCGV